MNVNDQVLIYGLNDAGEPIPLKVDVDGSLLIADAGGGPKVDRELVISTYRVKTAFTGASVGDTVTQTQVVDVSHNTPTTVGVLWRNQTTGIDLASPPVMVNLEQIESTGLTDAQLRAAAVVVSGPLTDTQLRAAAVVVSGPLTDAQLRASAIPVAPNLTRGSGAVDSNTQRVTLASDSPGVTGIASIDAKTPALVGGARPVIDAAVRDRLPAVFLTPGLLPVDTLATPNIPRVQATSGTAASIVLTTTCRRVSMYATQGTWYSLNGTATSSSHYIAAGERLDFDVAASTTISVLQETSAGSIRITELA